MRTSMTDAEFIKAHYGSFVDNVLLNQTSEFWMGTLTDDEDGAGYLYDGLHSAMKEWRERTEAAEPNGCVRCGAPGHDQPGCQWAAPADPHHTEEWYAAIDADIAFQEEFRGED